MFTCLQLTTYMFNSRAATKQMTETLDIHKVLISTCECLGNPCNSSQKFLSPCPISQTCSQNYRCTCCLLQQASNTRSSGTFRGVGCRSAAASALVRGEGVLDDSGIFCSTALLLCLQNFSR